MTDSVYRVEYEDLSQRVYRALKHMILVGELKTGEKLRQDELAERLGVSRTPLLSAFSKLEREMLVELVPRRGAFVKKYELAELVNIYEIRLRLEPLGAAEAARNGSREQIAQLKSLCDSFNAIVPSRDSAMKEMDYNIHMHLMKMSGNEILYNIVSSFNIIPIANFYGFFKEPEQSAAEHAALLTAIVDHDVSAARGAMFRHVDGSRRHLIELLAGS